jgi:hypothetical protein
MRRIVDHLALRRNGQQPDLPLIRWYSALFAVAVLAVATPAAAQVPLTPGCISYVADLYDIPALALDGLRAAEGGAVGKVTVNANGSWDIGPFQVNSSWVRYFKSVWRRASDAETMALLRDNGCANALAAAAIFRIVLDQAHGNVGEAVGYYNAPHNAALAARYRRHFLDVFRAARSRLSSSPTNGKELP